MNSVLFKNHQNNAIYNEMFPYAIDIVLQRNVVFYL